MLYTLGFAAVGEFFLSHSDAGRKTRGQRRIELTFSPLSLDLPKVSSSDGLSDSQLRVVCNGTPTRVDFGSTTIPVSRICPAEDEEPTS